MASAVLDYAPPARPKWLLRTLVIILIIAAGATVGAAIGDWVQPDLYIFNGSLAVPSLGAGTDMAAAKQAHINAIRASIPAAAATLNAQGIQISAAEFSNHMTLKDVPKSRLISIRCTSRSFNTTLAMVNALVIPYGNNVPGVTAMAGSLDRSTKYAAAGFVLGGAAAGLMIAMRRRRLMRT
ncbi:MAG: hypothetical protein H7144_10595 [Burkholderiales bacterium]|nr:hypothetical protein [Phycisphaerae bacterium]